jgi:uridine kinase
MLVGISGIDAGGKGYVTDRLSRELTSRGCKPAVINIDGWLNLTPIRFDHSDLAGNFYRNAIRFDEMFSQLVLPLREDRSIDVTADLAEETADEYRKHNYRFDDIDIILLEGIFLFKRELIQHYDLKIWIDCPFDTALERAVARSQEGLSPEATISAYETIYFPAQRIHFGLDDPRSAADIRIDN